MHIRGLREVVFVVAVGGNLAAGLLNLITWEPGWRSAVSLAINSGAAFLVILGHYYSAAQLERFHHSTRKIIAEANLAEAVFARVSAGGEDIQISGDLRKM